jgi:spermidine/putrescine transport system permease protein
MPDGGVVSAFGRAAEERREGPIKKAGWEKALDVIAEKGGKYLLGGATYLMFLLFFVPLIVVAIFSFNSEDSLIQFGGVSLEWWIGSQDRDGLFEDETAMLSIWYSVIVALASSLLAVFVGLFAAFAITRYRFRSRGALRTLMYFGLVVPSIIMGISLAVLIRFMNVYLLGPLSLGYGFADPVQWEFGLASVVVGHTTFNIPLATLVLIISYREFDRSLEEAAMNLGADEITTFTRVTLPNIMPGIISAILLGFTFSFDELPVTLFLYGGGVITVPIYIYGLIAKKIVNPRVNAMATIVLLLSLVFVLVINRFSKRGGQLFRM